MSRGCGPFGPEIVKATDGKILTADVARLFDLHDFFLGSAERNGSIVLSGECEWDSLGTATFIRMRIATATDAALRGFRDGVAKTARRELNDFDEVERNARDRGDAEWRLSDEDKESFEFHPSWFMVLDAPEGSAHAEEWIRSWELLPVLDRALAERELMETSVRSDERPIPVDLAVPERFLAVDSIGVSFYADCGTGGDDASFERHAKCVELLSLVNKSFDDLCRRISESGGIVVSPDSSHLCSPSHGALRRISDILDSGEPENRRLDSFQPRKTFTAHDKMAMRTRLNEIGFEDLLRMLPPEEDVLRTVPSEVSGAFRDDEVGF
jgi:hypothetical protein